MKFVVLGLSTLTLLISAPAFSLTPCVNGKAGPFECHSIDLLSRYDLSSQGAPGAYMANDIWGWTDSTTNREYIIMGLTNKASVVDVTNPEDPKHIIDIPTATTSSVWRDIKVYKDHAFIVSEAGGHGLQVFDLKQTRALLNAEPKSLPAIMQPVARYTEFGSAHNIAINEDSGFAYAVGTMTCDAGLHIIDIRSPQSPKFSTCVDRTIFEGTPAQPIRIFSPGDTYTHDVQCVNYKGPDLRYRGREICIASNSDTVNLVDVTDKANPRQISVLTYAGFGFVHQGWLTEDQRYYLQGDELDEIRKDHNTRTYMFDFQDLENPKFIGFHEYTTQAVDHNIYIKGNLAYAANYASGLRVLDVRKIAEAKLNEVAFFDIMPEPQDEDDRDMFGAWSVYPFFKSGTIAVSGMDKALYLLRLDENVEQ